jgi:hypothetical protein
VSHGNIEAGVVQSDPDRQSDVGGFESRESVRQRSWIGGDGRRPGAPG